MSETNIGPLSLLAAAFLSTIVFGMTLVFAIVVMPGIGKLDDVAFLQAFQEIDGVIQRKQPIFVSIWIGSVISIFLAAGFGWDASNNAERTCLVASFVVYLVAQVTTFAINVPLNNKIQALELTYLDAPAMAMERTAFEVSWNRWNWFRTVSFGGVSLCLSVLLLLAGSEL